MLKISSRINQLLWLVVFISGLASSACSTIQAVPPEINLMRIDVQDVTLSHVNLLADLRIFNPNDSQVTIQGVDYTLDLEGIRVFSGKSNLRQIIQPQEYGHLTLRLSSAYWDIIQLFNKLPDATEVNFSMQGTIRIGGSRLFAQRFTFDRQGIIPLQKLNP